MGNYNAISYYIKKRTRRCVFVFHYVSNAKIYLSLNILISYSHFLQIPSQKLRISCFHPDTAYAIPALYAMDAALIQWFLPYFSHLQNVCKQQNTCFLTLRSNAHLDRIYEFLAGTMDRFSAHGDALLLGIYPTTLQILQSLRFQNKVPLYWNDISLFLL